MSLLRNNRKIVIALGGASGSLYAKLLLDKLQDLAGQWEDIGIVLSDNAKINWQIELNTPFNTADYPFTFYDQNDFMAPFASGSAKYDTMVIVPCSMGLLGRIAHGISSDLTTRAADVMLKERRKLILVPRETPYSLIHIRNMETITLAGGIICPASPSLYSNPDSIQSFCMTVVDRIIDLMGLENSSYRWGES